jgi:hypothetical protein
MIKRGVVVAALLSCAAAQGAPALDFQLRDTLGREVRAQDYKGRSIFLEFGACW